MSARGPVGQPSVYDYVIVGGGTAGCVIAARLSENPSCRVCVIEAGGSDRSLWISTPMLYFIANAQPKRQWGYKTNPEAELNGRSLALSQAKVLGGASSINGMIYTRGYSKEYDAWKVPGWSFADLLPYFNRLERAGDLENASYGNDGPVQLTRAKRDLPLTEAFLSAAEAAGYPRVKNLNDEVAEGFGYVDYTIDRGRRAGASAAYLRGARRRPNLTVFTNSIVQRIMIENGRAIGVEIAGSPERLVIRADQEVIVTAGAINTPKILMLSGIGPAAHLRPHGIAVHADLAGVGANLGNHLRYALRYETNVPISAYRYRHPARAMLGGLDYLLRRRGFLAGTALPISGVIRTDPASELPTVKVSLSTALFGTGNGWSGMMPTRHGFSLMFYQCTPHSRGDVRLRSSSPADPPSITPRHLHDPRDLEVLLDAVDRVSAIAAQPPLSRIISSPGQHSSRDELIGAIRAAANNVYHTVGTCRLGIDAQAVVDPQLRVQGVEALRVADCSIIPNPIGSGTYALALMIGEKASDLISNYASNLPDKTELAFSDRMK